jgi:hypothetical protein
MTIKVTFTFETVEEAAAFITGKATPTTPMEKPKRVRASRPETPVENAAPMSVEEQATGLTPEQVAKIEPVKAAPKVPNAPVQAVATASLEAVRNALREVFNTKGAAAATEVLKQFGAARVGEVKPADYAAFIKACAK